MFFLLLLQHRSGTRPRKTQNNSQDKADDEPDQCPFPRALCLLRMRFALYKIKNKADQRKKEAENSKTGTRRVILCNRTRVGRLVVHGATAFQTNHSVIIDRCPAM